MVAAGGYGHGGNKPITSIKKRRKEKDGSRAGKGRIFQIEVLLKVHLGKYRCGRCVKKVCQEGALVSKHFQGVLRPQRAYTVYTKTMCPRTERQGEVHGTRELSHGQFNGTDRSALVI